MGDKYTREENILCIRPWIPTLLPGGVQTVYRFDNGYGASVVPEIGHAVSINPIVFPEGHGNLREVAVLKFSAPDDEEGGIHYGNPVARGDVLRFLDEEALNKALERIATLNWLDVWEYKILSAVSRWLRRINWRFNDLWRAVFNRKKRGKKCQDNT